MRRFSSFRLAAMVLAAALASPVSAACPLPSHGLGAEAVGPQYDTTHVYVSPSDFDGFVASLLTTFGGKASKAGVYQVTPTASQTRSQLVLTPAGTFSVFGFVTPIPYPFGSERTGYLVRDLDAAVKAARATGGSVLVAPFPDAIGRDAVVQWPGGANMQFYWHTSAPAYAPLAHTPENRIYIAEEAVSDFVAAWECFAGARVVTDDLAADGADIGRPGSSFRRVRMTSGFGELSLLVTDGHLPWPYGRELAGYLVADLDATLARARASGATILAPRYEMHDRSAAMIQFPGGYIAEIHADRRAAP